MLCARFKMELEKRTCPVCKKEFIAGPMMITCSDKCFDEFHEMMSVLGVFVEAVKTAGVKEK